MQELGLTAKVFSELQFNSAYRDSFPPRTICNVRYTVYSDCTINNLKPGGSFHLLF